MGTVVQTEASREIGTAVRHAFVYGLGSMATKAISFLLLPVFTHYLRPADYGALEVLDLTMSLLGMLLNMGVMAAILRFYAMAKSPAEKHRVISTAFLGMAISACCIGTIGFWSLRPASAALFGPKISPVYAGLCFGAFLLNYIATVPYTYIRAKEASGTLVMIDVVTGLSTTALTVFCLVVLKWSLYGVLWSTLVICFVRSPLLIAWSIRETGVRFDRDVFRKMAAFGVPLVFSNLAMFILNFSDRFFLQRLRSLDVVGVYATGYKFGFLLNFVFIQSFNMMWQARMYIIHRERDHERIFAQVLVLYSVLVNFAALGLSLFSNDIVRMMIDRRYSGAEAVIPVVSLAYVCLAIGSFLQLGLYLSGKSGIIGILCAFAGLFSIGLNYVLISSYGMLGAAWATVLGFALLGIGSYYCAQRIFPLRLRVGRVMLSVVIAMILYGVSRVWGSWPVWTAFTIKAILLLSYPGILLLTRVVATEELATIRALRVKLVEGVGRLPIPAWARSVLAGE